MIGALIEGISNLSLVSMSAESAMDAFAKAQDERPLMIRYRTPKSVAMGGSGSRFESFRSRVDISYDGPSAVSALHSQPRSSACAVVLRVFFPTQLLVCYSASCLVHHLT